MCLSLTLRSFVFEGLLILKTSLRYFSVWAEWCGWVRQNENQRNGCCLWRKLVYKLGHMEIFSTELYFFLLYAVSKQAFMLHSTFNFFTWVHLCVHKFSASRIKLYFYYITYTATEKMSMQTNVSEQAAPAYIHHCTSIQ